MHQWKCVTVYFQCVDIHVEKKKQIVEEYLEYGSNSKQEKLNFIIFYYILIKNQRIYFLNREILNAM